MSPSAWTSREPSEAKRSRVVAGLAVIWSAVFTGLHLGWALGNRAFLGSSPAAEAAFVRPSFAIYNDVVVILCAIGIVIPACVLAPRHLPTRVLRVAMVLCRVACVLLVLRGGIGVVQTLLGLGPAPENSAAYNFDPWFLLGGVLFGPTAYMAGTVRPSARSQRSPLSRRPRRRCWAGRCGPPAPLGKAVSPARVRREPARRSAD